jgi:tRNA pseudouridine38-40 synthase
MSLAETTKILLVMEYDGTRYHGFQWQDGLPSIQGEVEKALAKLTGERRRVMGASRTDAGVHARGQVVSFRTGSALPTPNFVSGLNHYLPADIAVKAAYRINDDFNVRREAISREYSYYILNRPTRSPIREGFAYLVAGGLDIGAMNEACLALVGEHDFASFAGRNGASVKSTVRRVFRAVVEREGELVIFNIAAGSFLLHQVRNTVGALIRVGQGKMTIDEFSNILEARELALAGPTAPAYGLCLNRVNYPGPLENYDENL